MSYVLSDTWALLGRWLIHARRDVMSLTVGLTQPLIWLGLFGGLFRGFFAKNGLSSFLGDVDYLSFYTPGVIVFTLLTNSVLGGIPIVFDRENGFIDKVLSAPVSRVAIVASRFIYVTLYSLAQGYLVLGFALLMGVRFAANPVYVVGAIAVFGALLAAGVTALSLALAFKAPHHAVFFTITGFFLTPFLVLSSAFVPLSRMPDGWMRVLAQANPLTHAIEPIRALVCGTQAVGEPAYGLHLVVLVGFDVACIFLATKVIRSRLD